MWSLGERGQASIKGTDGRSDAVCGELTSNGTTVARMAMDGESEVWVEHLPRVHPRRDDAVAQLHEVLVRIAYHELARRRGQLPSISGPEFDDLAQQAADDALMSILGKLDDFRRLSHFTTWAYKFVIFEVSGTARCHAWQQAPTEQRGQLDVRRGARMLAPRPGDRLEQRSSYKALSPRSAS